MSGGGAAILTLYDLLWYWAVAVLSAIISKPLHTPPLLFYLVFGALLGNFHLVNHSEGIAFFAEWAITIVFFALGFEETVEHFVHGVAKAWGIASIGAAIPFGCGWLVGVIFWPNHGWWVHLTIATAVTATAVSLTMIVLKSVGLLRSKAAMGIMTSAVLDDVGCLVLVAILIPIIVAAAPVAGDTSMASSVPSECLLLASNSTTNITGTLHFTGNAFGTMSTNATAWSALSAAIKEDLMSATQAPFTFVTLAWLNLTSDGKAVTQFSMQPSELISLNPNTVDNGISTIMVSNLDQVGAVYASSSVGVATDAPTLSSYSVQNVVVPTVKQTGFLDVLWIIGKVVIFFAVVVFLHHVILPHDVTTGPISYIPLIRTYGIRHLLNVCGGQQVPLISVTFGLGLGMVGAALGFHPAVGAYFAGLILEERYFDLILPEPEEADEEEDNEEDQLIKNNEAGTAEGPAVCITNADDGAQPVEDTNGAAATTTSGAATPGGADGPTLFDVVEPAPVDVNEQETCFTRSQAGVSMTGLEDARNSEGDDGEEMSEVEEEHHNTMERCKEAVGTAAFLWLGPVFFVNLGAGLEIDVNLLAVGIPQALAMAAILWVGQFISATLAARFVPGGFSWAEAALVGFGMLGRAELYFVVLNVAKTEGIIGNEIFFPMALGAMFMNVSLPVAVSLFRPAFKRAHPEDVDWVEGDPEEEKDGVPDAEAPATGDDGEPPAPVRSMSQRTNTFIFGVGGPTPKGEDDARSALGARKKNTLSGRRGIGQGGFEMDMHTGAIAGRSPSALRSRTRGKYGVDISPSNRSAVGNSSRVSGAKPSGRKQRRRNSQQVDVWDEPERPAGMAGGDEDDNPYLQNAQSAETAGAPESNEPVA